MTHPKLDPDVYTSKALQAVIANVELEYPELDKGDVYSALTVALLQLVLKQGVTVEEVRTTVELVLQNHVGYGPQSENLLKDDAIEAVSATFLKLSGVHASAGVGEVFGYMFGGILSLMEEAVGLPVTMSACRKALEREKMVAARDSGKEVN